MTAIPRSATVAAYAEGVIKQIADRPNCGKFATITLYETEESHGYKTDYERVPVRYIRVVVEEEAEWSLSNRDIPQ